jgi:hypothetical protein
MYFNQQNRHFVTVQAVWENLQAFLDPLNPLANPLGHQALPLPVLRQKVPPEVRHEEAHLHSHR